MRTFILLSYIFLTGFTIVPEKEVKCLAKNIYFEARDQKVKGQIAVALVTINRVNSKRFPNSILLG